MRAFVTALFLLGQAACASTVPGAAGPGGHHSPQEQRNLARIEQIHAPGLGLIQRLRESGSLAEDAEWWVAGPPEVLPFAGSWRGLEGVAEFQRRLVETLRYDRVELQEYLVSADHVAVIFLGEGVARATGRPFRSEIVRLYTFRDGRIVRVRTYYDTAAYVAAVQGLPPTACGAPPVSTPSRTIPGSPREASALIAAADSLAAARRYHDASERYAAALSLRPDSLGVARRALGTFWRAARYDDAYRWGRRVLAVEPNTPGVLFDVGVACGFLLELECVDSIFRRTVAIDPTYVYGHGELAFLAQARGRLREAVRHMEGAHAVAPEDDFAVSGLAQMLIPAGEPERAKALMEPRLAANRQARAYGGRSMRTLYGWALLEMGDTAGAHAAFDEVLGRLREREQAGQTTYQLYRERAAIHALRGDRVAAIAAMHAAFDRGWRLYGSWSLPDPMFASVLDDPAVRALLDRMRADVRAMRQRLGLDGGAPGEMLP